MEYTRRLTNAGRRDRGGSARGGAGADGGVAAAGTVAGILLYCFQNQFLEAGEGMTCFGNGICRARRPPAHALILPVKK